MRESDITMKRRTLAVVREESARARRATDVDWLVYALVAGVGALCYANSLDGEFVHDDIPAVVANKDVTGENPIYEVFLNDFWGTPMADINSHKSYRPLTTLSFRLNYWLCGPSPRWWHACNVALHAACCALVARAAARVARLRRPFAALAALLFAVHPVHTEAVAGVVGRADALACVFYLSSILVYHGYSDGGGSGNGGSRRMWRGCALAALGVLAKETGLAALLANAAIDLHRSWAATGAPNKSGNRWAWGQSGLAGRLIRWAAALALVAGVRLLLLQGALPVFSPQDNPPAFHPHLLVRAMTFWYLAAFNWWLLLCPWGLSHDWQMGSVPLLTSPADPRNLLTGAALLALAALAYRCFADLEVVRHTPAVVGLVLLVTPYLPASNLFVTVGFVIAERVLYIPSVGSVIITVYGVQLMYERSGRGGRGGLLVAVVLLALAGAARTHLRNRDWRTRESLLRADLTVLPHNAKLHYNFANYLKDTDQPEYAIKHYKEALRLWPSYASAHNNLGTLVGAPLAEHHFAQALRHNARHVNAHYNLGKLYRKKNLLSESVRMLERCVELAPRFVPARLELLALRPRALRRQLLDQLLDLEPANWEHRLLYGNWLKDTGYKLHALKYYLEAMRLAFKSRSSERSGRGDLASLRMSCLVLRDMGQTARALQLITRWHTHFWGSRAHNLYLREWRRRAELAGRAQLYSRPHAHLTTTTCFHHTQLELPHQNSPTQLMESDSRSDPVVPAAASSRGRRMQLGAGGGSLSELSSGDCRKTTGVVSIPALYKHTHNKSESGHKKKRRSVCAKKEINRIKEPHKVIAPYIPGHLTRTF